MCQKVTRTYCTVYVLKHYSVWKYILKNAKHTPVSQHAKFVNNHSIFLWDNIIKPQIFFDKRCMKYRPKYRTLIVSEEGDQESRLQSKYWAVDIYTQ
jgi:hypothetical protein